MTPPTIYVYTETRVILGHHPIKAKNLGSRHPLLLLLKPDKDLVQTTQHHTAHIDTSHYFHCTLLIRIWDVCCKRRVSAGIIVAITTPCNEYPLMYPPLSPIHFNRLFLFSSTFLSPLPSRPPEQSAFSS